ncbi:hypothetical protein ACHAWF_009682 [Thalassiosira exigua]
MIAVNPIGWYGSTMNTPIDKHEDNAEEVMELLKLLGIEKAMVGGYSTVMQYLVESAISMPGKLEATVANIRFNITPIKTPYAEPSDALRGLESKVIVLHGSQDDLVPHEVMEHVTKLAIADQWAPPGKLSFYDDGGSHMIVIDNPRAFASTYRRALEEQVLSN